VVTFPHDEAGRTVNAPARQTAALAVAWSGAVLFVLSLLFFLYCYAFRFAAPAPPGSAGGAALLNLVLFTVFATHHSVLARSRVKARVRRVLPAPLERSAYTWVASVLFILVCAFWQPVPGELYQLTGAAGIGGYAVQLLGILLTARSSARLDVLDLAGVRPVLRAGSGREAPRVPLETNGLYGFVRHPVYFGWVLFVFGAPHMTMTRLVFAVTSTAYLAVAIPFEERGLVQTFGPDYLAYRERVRWRMIPGIY
jgi:protein-S-isoprenylcysteine O-methyltransferase Ste14